MSTDIHWAIERRDMEGRWRLVACEDRSLAMGQARGIPHHDPSREAEQEISFRDYELFAALSGVRGYAESELATPGMPMDAAADTLAVVKAWGGDYPGWIDGPKLDSIIGPASPGKLDRSKDWTPQQALEHWGTSVLRFLHEGNADGILPPPRTDGRPLYYPDAWPDLGEEAAETSHERLERIKDSQRLIDWRTDHSAYRIVVWYDL